MNVVSSEGHYFYKQTTDDDTVCGVYIFTEPDRTVEIHFNYVDVPCENGGLVSVRRKITPNNCTRLLVIPKRELVTVIRRWLGLEWGVIGLEKLGSTEQVVSCF